MIQITPDILKAIYRHARETYPHECCGFLVGTPGDPRVCRRSVRASNIRPDRKADRYELDPLDWLRTEKAASADGEAIIGIYHSHPDHPSRPSEFDREHAHPHMSYIIASVARTRINSCRSWTLDPSTRQFAEEKINAGQGTEMVCHPTWAQADPTTD